MNSISWAQICHPQLIFAGEDGDCDNNPYVLVFEDNFDGDSLDLMKWQIQPWGQGSLSGDNTQQYYSLDNITISSGICTIEARRDTVVRRAVSWLSDTAILADGIPNLRTYYYTSSNIWTYQQFGHGKYEIRCRIPNGKGFWPAFWMYGADSASSSEIDVFEFWDDNTVKHHMTAHYTGLMCTSSYDGPDYSQAFHTYTVIWDEYKIEWYVDEVLKRRLTRYNNLLGQNIDCNGVNAGNPYILEKTYPEDSMNIIVNVAIQKGDFAPDSNTVFPAAMEIDYIRYYAQIPVISDDENTVSDQADGIRIKAYPNPGNKTLLIDIENAGITNYEISLLDEKGEIAYHMTSSEGKNFSIDVSTLRRGIYLLHFQDLKNKKEPVRKIILQ